jgi:hypothetical protein
MKEINKNNKVKRITETEQFNATHYEVKIKKESRLLKHYGKAGETN